MKYLVLSTLESLCVRHSLRNDVIAEMERSIRAEAWKKLEEHLGLRPVGKAEGKQRRRDR